MDFPAYWTIQLLFGAFLGVCAFIIAFVRHRNERKDQSEGRR